MTRQKWTDEQKRTWLRSMAVRLESARRYKHKGGLTLVTIVMPAGAADIVAELLRELDRP